MNDGEPIAQALRKLDWIAKLSKETLPGGVPADREGMRMLPNRIVLDVRAARRILSDVAGFEAEEVDALIASGAVFSPDNAGGFG